MIGRHHVVGRAHVYEETVRSNGCGQKVASKREKPLGSVNVKRSSVAWLSFSARRESQ